MSTKKENGRCKVHFVKILVTIVLHIIRVIGKDVKEDGLIYILEWTRTNVEPFSFLEKEQTAFVNRKCKYQNCYLTSNNSFFTNILSFDALIFNAWNLKMDRYVELPSVRSKRQKYILVAMEPSGYYPISEEYNGFFKLTWTYKLDSNITFPYIVIKNQFDEIVGPKVDMHWIKLKDMNETSKYVKSKLQNKYVAAAWIVSNCNAVKRLAFAKKLQKELSKYGLRVDIYGRCGDYRCPRLELMDECYALIETDYYFYLAFENSYSTDYVSEKLLHALEHFAVPVVLGGANYSRFMPEGTYLDALGLNPLELAKRMSDIINDKNNYYEFFRWHGYYSFHFTGEDGFRREVCGLCEFRNNIHETSVFSDIVEWWNEGQPPSDAMSAPQWDLILADDEEQLEEGIGQRFLNVVFEK